MIFVLCFGIVKEKGILLEDFKEFDTRKKAKDLAEFITPPILRQFINQKVKGDNLNILDISIGSGQLLFELNNRISTIVGFDVNSESLKACKQNFKDKATLYNMDFITNNIELNQDICICNYPFSLKATEEQEKFILNDNFLKQFYDKRVTGLLDFIFILKSFEIVKEGYYLCFPGVGYRKQEEKFRKYLIDNNFIKEYGLINNCQFEHTNISILYIHLTKEKEHNPKSFSLDLKTNELLEDKFDFEDYVFKYPQKETIRKKINHIEVEQQAREQIFKQLKKQYELSLAMYQFDNSLKVLPSPEKWIKEMCSEILKTKPKEALNKFFQGSLF